MINESEIQGQKKKTIHHSRENNLCFIDEVFIPPPAYPVKNNEIEGAKCPQFSFPPFHGNPSENFQPVLKMAEGVG